MYTENDNINWDKIKEMSALPMDELDRMIAEEEKHIRELLEKHKYYSEHPEERRKDLLAKRKYYSEHPEEAIKDIYKTSTKTNEDVNKELGIEGE